MANLNTAILANLDDYNSRNIERINMPFHSPNSNRSKYANVTGVRGHEWQHGINKWTPPRTK